LTRSTHLPVVLLASLLTVLLLTVSASVAVPEAVDDTVSIEHSGDAFTMLR
jgi:hypothetical protein